MCFFLAFKGHLQRCPFCFAFIWFRVQGSGLRWRLRRFFYWGNAQKWHLSHQLLVTPTIRGKESSHMRGMRSFGSVPTCSGWGFSHIERFRPFRMTIRGSRRVFIWRYVACFGTIGVIYDTSRPLETEVPQRDFRVWPNPKRRLACPLRRLPVRPNGPRRRRRMDPRSGVKNYVRLPVSLKRHPDRSGGIFLADR